MKIEEKQNWVKSVIEYWCFLSNMQMEQACSYMLPESLFFTPVTKMQMITDLCSKWQCKPPIGTGFVADGKKQSIEQPLG